MAAAAIAVHLPKHASFLPNPKLPLNQNSDFLGVSLKIGRPMSVNRKMKGPVTVSAASTSKTVVTDGDRSKQFYINFTGFPFPLGPFLNRRTIRTEVRLLNSLRIHYSAFQLAISNFDPLLVMQAVKGSIWMFEQEQALGFSSVSTNIRMTVIKLKSGGLWVHAPIAPTKECIQVPLYFYLFD